MRRAACFGGELPYFFVKRLRRKRIVPVRTVVMPGFISSSFPANRPTNKEIMEIITLRMRKLLKLFARFLAVTAGIMESALIRRIPTKLIPIVIVSAIRERRRSSALFSEIFSARLRSGAIEKRMIFFLK